uniref:Transmembrane protein n=1 Tax=Magnetococcus massalia (strain MO-1) TaxID=451514 RepID=A0A1S7LG68_MAGMO|nr:Conserved outer membrane protein of unknown function [Candidatus Magnetococcus massalia]
MSNGQRFSRAWQMIVRSTIAVGLLLALLPASPVQADDGVTRQREKAIKVALIYNLAKFVKWPQEQSISSRFNLCIFGQNPFGDSIKILNSRTVQGRPIQLYLSDEPRQFSRCHLVFMGHPQSLQFTPQLRPHFYSPVLTVSDHPDFNLQGGMVYLGREGKRIKLTVNRSAIKRSRLTLSAQVYQLAHVVTDEFGE